MLHFKCTSYPQFREDSRDDALEPKIEEASSKDQERQPMQPALIRPPLPLPLDSEEDLEEPWATDSDDEGGHLIM